MKIMRSESLARLQLAEDRRVAELDRPRPTAAAIRDAMARLEEIPERASARKALEVELARLAVASRSPRKETVTEETSGR